MQEHDGILHPIQYLSRNLSKTERNYSTIERECLAIVWSLQKFQKYLLGKKFMLLTDHKPLVAFNKKKISNAKVNRWAMQLADFQFEIKPIRGKDNVIADILSRMIMNTDSMWIDKQWKKNCIIAKELRTRKFDSTWCYIIFDYM